PVGGNVSRGTGRLNSSKPVSFADAGSLPSDSRVSSSPAIGNLLRRYDPESQSFPGGAAWRSRSAADAALPGRGTLQLPTASLRHVSTTVVFSPAHLPSLVLPTTNAAFSASSPTLKTLMPDNCSRSTAASLSNLGLSSGGTACRNSSSVSSSTSP